MPRARRASTPIFATAPYEADEQGQLRAVLPTRCPFASPEEDGCRLGVNHRRERKTGPCFPLDVVRCARHPVHSFTLYPAGHFPYGRTALARCSVAGPLLTDAETGEPVWGGTIFEAAQQADCGVRWPSHSATDAPAVRRTQGRHLELAGLLLGVHPDLDDGEREQIATRLRLPTMTLRSAAALWSVSWSLRGAAIALVHAALAIDGSLLDRLLSAGYAAGLWAQPRRWEPPNHWVVARSTEPERPADASSESRAPPPTKSLVAVTYRPDPPSPPP